MNLRTEMTNAISDQSNVSVYAAVDISISMCGPKIRQVCASMYEMLEAWPDSVLIDITLFNGRSRKIVHAMKSTVHIDRVIEEIEKSCGQQPGTALYDAWGDMISAIPDSAFTNDEVQIFVLTDGVDNASSRYTLESVQALTYERVKHITNFTLIQVGKSVNQQVLQSLHKAGVANRAQVQTMCVDNDAKGIKTALDSVNLDILKSIRTSGMSKKKGTRWMLKTPHPASGIILRYRTETAVPNESLDEPMSTTTPKSTPTETGGSYKLR